MSIISPDKRASASDKKLICRRSRKVGRSQRVDATLSDLEVVLMRQGRRYGLSAEQKADISER